MRLSTRLYAVSVTILCVVWLLVWYTISNGLTGVPLWRYGIGTLGFVGMACTLIGAFAFCYLDIHPSRAQLLNKRRDRAVTEICEIIGDDSQMQQIAMVVGREVYGVAKEHWPITYAQSKRR